MSRTVVDMARLPGSHHAGWAKLGRTAYAGHDVPPGPYPAQVSFGVYVHVPFCRHRCDYCAFATWTDRHHLEARYLAACRRQVTDAAPGLPPVTSVFVGGGTPSLVDPDGLLAARLNPQLVEASKLDDPQAAELRFLLERHRELTGSPRAASMLDDWDATLRSFWRVAPVGEVARIERANQNVIGAAR